MPIPVTLELGSIHDPATRRAFEQIVTQLSGVVITGGGGGGAPSGPAGGVLSGTYPDPGFAVDMATQAELDAHTTLTTTAHGGIVASTDPRLTDARTPTAHKTSHEPGGTDVLTGLTNASIAAGAGIAKTKLASLDVVNADVNAAAAIARSKLDFGSGLVNADIAAAAAIAETKLSLATDAAAGTGSRRTIGTGALQAAAGNDSRLSDARTPTAHATTHQPGGSDAMAVDAAAATGSLRTLGTTATSAAAGNRGLPVGGTTGQVLSKNSATDYDAGWTTPAGGGSIFYDDLQPGVVGSGDTALTVNTTAQVTTAAGTVYHSVSGVLTRLTPGSTVLGSIPAASASNFRLDQIVMSTAGVVSRLAGTQGTTVTLANRTGAAALGTSLLLHDVLVTATGVAAANCRDRRPWARGAFWRQARTVTNLTTASLTHGAIGDTSFQARIECSGAPLRITLNATGFNTSATGSVATGMFMDGAAVTGSPAAGDLQSMVSTTASSQGSVGFVHTFAPAAGSHLFIPSFRAITGGTATLFIGGGGGPLELILEEIILPNANNGTT